MPTGLVSAEAVVGELIPIKLENVYLENGYGTPSNLFDQQDQVKAQWEIAQQDISKIIIDKTTWKVSVGTPTNSNYTDLDAISYVDLGKEYEVSGGWFHQIGQVDLSLFAGVPNVGWGKAFFEKKGSSNEWAKMEFAPIKTRYLRINLQRTSQGIDELFFTGKPTGSEGKKVLLNKIEIPQTSVTNLYGRVQKVLDEKYQVGAIAEDTTEKELLYQAIDLVDEQDKYEVLPNLKSDVPKTKYGIGFGAGRIATKTFNNPDLNWDDKFDKDKYITVDFDLRGKHDLERLAFYFSEEPFYHATPPREKWYYTYNTDLELYAGNSYEELNDKMAANDFFKTIKLVEGDPGKPEDIPKINLNQWVSLSLKDDIGKTLETSMLRMVFKADQKWRTYLGEVLVYGTPLEKMKSTAKAIPVDREPLLTMDQFIGVNSFVWNSDLSLYNGDGNMRQYVTSSGQIFRRDTFGELDWKETGFDAFYAKMKTAGILVHPAVQGGFKYLNGTDSGIPVPFPDDGVKNLPAYLEQPESYKEHAYLMYQYAARYGGNAKIDPKTINNFDKTDKTVGLSSLSYYENENEPDGLWKMAFGGQEGKEKKTGGGYLGPEYAAMTSADYDGHSNTMKPEIKNGVTQVYGMHNADPNAKLVMAGLSYYNLDYVKSVDYWMKNNRPDGKNPIDVINFHHYTGRISPEADNTYNQLKQLREFVYELNPHQEVWWSEFGWDSNQVPGANPTIMAGYGDEKETLEKQAQWLTRTYLIGAAAGLDRMQMYMLDGTDTHHEKFATSGLLHRRSIELKPSYYFLNSTKNILQGTKFSENVAMTKDAYVYKFSDEEKDVYALWRPTEDGLVTKNYELEVGQGTVMLNKLDKEKLTGVAEGMVNETGSIYVDLSETPIYVTVNKTNLNIPMPTPDITAKSYFKEATVKLESMPGTTVYYTLDGKTPTAKSTEFSVDSPIVLKESTVIKAIAIDKKGNKSNQANLGFEIISDFDFGGMTTVGGTLMSKTATIPGEAIVARVANIVEEQFIAISAPLNANKVTVNFSAKGSDISATNFPIYLNKTAEEVLKDFPERRQEGAKDVPLGEGTIKLPITEQYQYSPLEVDLTGQETTFKLTMRAANNKELMKDFYFTIRKEEQTEGVERDPDLIIPENSDLLIPKAGNVLGESAKKQLDLKLAFDGKAEVSNQMLTGGIGDGKSITDWNAPAGSKGFIDFGDDWQKLRITGAWTLYQKNASSNNVVPFKSVWWSKNGTLSNENLTLIDDVTEENKKGIVDFSTKTNLPKGGTVSNQWIKNFINQNNPVVPQGRYLIIEKDAGSGMPMIEFALSGYYSDSVAEPASLTVKFEGEDEEELAKPVVLSSFIGNHLNLAENKEISERIVAIKRQNYFNSDPLADDFELVEKKGVFIYRFSGDVKLNVDKKMSFKAGLLGLNNQQLAYSGDQDFILAITDTRGISKPAEGERRGKFRIEASLDDDFINFTQRKLDGVKILYNLGGKIAAIEKERSVVIYNGFGEVQQESSKLDINLTDQKIQSSLVLDIPNSRKAVADYGYYSNIVWQIVRAP